MNQTEHQGYELEEDDLDGAFGRPHAAAVADAEKRLHKLNMAELRMRARYYFEKYCDAQDMRKADLVWEVAPELVADDR
jgi:hypothetical protein